jgi:hypothetical protein
MLYSLLLAKANHPNRDVVLGVDVALLGSRLYGEYFHKSSKVIAQGVREHLWTGGSRDEYLKVIEDDTMNGTYAVVSTKTSRHAKKVLDWLREHFGSFTADQVRARISADIEAEHLRMPMLSLLENKKRDPKTEKVLLKWIEHPNADVRLSAAQIMGMLAWPALEKALEKHTDDDKRVRRVIQYALKSKKSSTRNAPTAKRPAIQDVRNSSSPARMRRAAKPSPERGTLWFYAFVEGLPGVKTANRYGCWTWNVNGKRFGWQWPLTPADEKRRNTEGLQGVNIAVALDQVPARRGFYSTKGLRVALIALVEAAPKDVKAAIAAAHRAARA